MVTSTTSPASRSYLFLTSLLMRENPETAESKSPVSEDEAATAQSGIPLYIIWRGNCNILTVCFELTMVVFCNDVKLLGIFLCG